MRTGQLLIFIRLRCNYSVLGFLVNFLYFGVPVGSRAYPSLPVLLACCLFVASLFACLLLAVFCPFRVCRLSVLCRFSSAFVCPSESGPLVSRLLFPPKTRVGNGLWLFPPPLPCAPRPCAGMSGAGSVFLLVIVFFLNVWL